MRVVNLIDMEVMLNKKKEEVDINKSINGKRFEYGVKGFVHLEKYHIFVDVKELG